MKRLSFFLFLTVQGLIPALAGGNPKLTVQAEFHVSLTCIAEIPYGSLVRMTNTVAPFTVYEAITDSSGIAVIQNITTGQYNIQVYRFNYLTYSTQVNLQSNLLLNIQLNQLIKPPSGLEVNVLSLRATWNAPPVDTVLLSEDWSSGNFTANQWTVTGGSNWIINNNVGHSPPSALFGGALQVINYDQYLTSRVIPAAYAANMRLYYETSLSYYYPGEYLAVEISAGSSWQMLKEYSSLNGSWNFTPEVLDISAWSVHPFQIRFHAHGEDSYNINYWAIDNIRIVAEGTVASPSPCVTGYSVFLNSTLVGTTSDTNYLLSPDLVQYGQTNQVCVKAGFSNGVSQSVCNSFTSQYLYPPRYFNVQGIENAAAYLTWQKPQLSNGSTPQGLTGFRICRNGLNIKIFNSIDTLWWWDYIPEEGTYYYTVNAIYDLAAYGQPGQTGYSLQAGPESVSTYSCCLPFHEGWDQGSFAYLDWSFQPSQGNWMISTSAGNPFPAACFTGSPVMTNYSYSLISDQLNASFYSCADVFLDYDYKLSQMQPSASDFLSVEINRGGDLWETVEQYGNLENTDWVHKHILLPDAGGMLFKVRFRVHGNNSGMIDTWCVDNISVYVICRAPDLSGSSGNNAVILTWTPPVCGGSALTNWWYYDDGSSETGYGGDALQNRWFGNQFSVGSIGPIKIQEIEAYFRHRPDHGTDLVAFEIFNEDHILIVTSPPFIPPENEWIDISMGLLIPPQNDVYVMVHYMGPVHVSDPVGYDTNGTVYTDEWAWVYDGSSWIKVTAAYGAPIGCFLIRLRATIETDSPVSTPLYSHPDFLSSTSESVLKGYNIYRSDLTGNDPYVKLNSSLCQDTSYVDPIPPGIQGIYCYYVTSVYYADSTNYPVCESSSDTVCFDIPLGFEKIPDTQVHIYPIPVTDELTVESDRLIGKIDLFDCFGRVMIEKNGILGKRIHISFSNLPQGIYILKVVCDGGVIARKVVKQ